MNIATTLPHSADRFFIGGEWIRASTDRTIDVVDPTSEQLFLSVAEAREEDLQRAVAAARTAFDQGPWPRMSHADRAPYLREIGRLLQERSDELASIWSHEIGITLNASKLRTGGMPGVFDYHASLAESFPWEERHKPAVRGEIGLLVREPVGVVAAVLPWNAPLAMICWKVAPALIAGCTIVLKPSPEAPGEAQVFAEICAAAGLPKGVVNVITAERDISEMLISHPAIDKVTFTGSLAAGKRIGSICGGRIARYTLELGGKSAAIILDDYDLDAFVTSFVQTFPVMTGQVCALLTRILVNRHRHDELVERIADGLSRVRIGDPFDTATDMGPVAAGRHLDRVLEYVARGSAEGARLAYGGGRPDHLDRGFFIEPTVFGGVSAEMAIAQEEIFGPVAGVIPFDTEEEAIRIANDSIFGLAGSVFTNDVDRAYHVARGMRTGTITQNGQRADFSIGFGGFKQSGVGREGGDDGIRAFTEAKTIILDGVPSHVR